uniref:RRM domain-containing protein n=1 Tax=Anas platyrhynchos platyrhynchos TaxID=8840 RepID=A0A493T8T4_ANAPP
ELLQPTIPRAWLAGVPPPGPSSRHGAPCPQEERRVVFIGKIPSRMTRSELRHRFSVFGDIEESLGLVDHDYFC